MCIYIYIYILFVCVSVYHLHTWCSQRPERVSELLAQLWMVASHHVGDENLTHVL